MIENKIIGIVLLICGLSMILWSVYISYNMFQGNRPVPEILTPQIETGIEVADGSTPTQIDEQIKQTIQEQMANILPQANVYKLLNLIVWSIFAWIMIIAGTKISSLGIGMLK